MSSSLRFSPHFPLPCNLRSRIPVVLASRNHYRVCRIPRVKRFVCALNGNLEASWIQLQGSSDDDGCGGWSVRRLDASDGNGLYISFRDIPVLMGFIARNCSSGCVGLLIACFAGLTRFLISVMGTSVVAILLVAVAYCACSRKCFKFKLNAPLSIFHDLLMPSGTSKGTVEVKESATSHIYEVQVGSTEQKSDVLNQEDRTPASGENKRAIIRVAADPTQMNAMYVLKRLKIIEYDASPDDLCTRREYARWLVKANSMLERKVKHKIASMYLIAGALAPAFDDVNMNDSDFWCIQSLGEAGIVSSRLSSSNSFSMSNTAKSNDEESFFFFPDSFISRLDAVNWRALIEYSVSYETEQKISLTNVGLLDLSASNLGASPELLMDLMSGNGSIVRRTFGNIRRLQPHRPVTKAQAAVALTSGRMVEEIRNELSRLEVEEQSRLAEMEEIRSELICRGDMQKYWEEKLSKEREFALQVDRNLESALCDLKMERAAEDERLAYYIKENAVLEIQQQLLLSLKKEVDEMFQKLGSERAILMTEKQNLDIQLKDLLEERNAVFEAKSVLEAEKEAIQILKSWVEEEAGRIRARAKFLEQAVQRWKGDGTTLPEQ